MMPCETMPTTDHRHSCGCAVKRGEDEQRRLGVSLMLYYCLLFRLSMNNGMCSAEIAIQKYVDQRPLSTLCTGFHCCPS